MIMAKIITKTHPNAKHAEIRLYRNWSNSFILANNSPTAWDKDSIAKRDSAIIRISKRRTLGGLLLVR